MVLDRPVVYLASPDGTSPGFGYYELDWWRAPFARWVANATLSEASRKYRILSRARRMKHG
jgi:hypothetical protein